MVWPFFYPFFGSTKISLYFYKYFSKSQKYFQKNVKKTARPKPIREYFYKLF